MKREQRKNRRKQITNYQKARVAHKRRGNMKITLINLSKRKNADLLKEFLLFKPSRIEHMNLDFACARLIADKNQVEIKREVELVFLALMEEYEHLENIDYIALPVNPEVAVWVGYELSNNLRISEALPKLI